MDRDTVQTNAVVFSASLQGAETAVQCFSTMDRASENYPDYTKYDL